MKKQSSIEWLVEELNKSTSLTSFVHECSDDYKKEILGIIEQAKEKHKQEIIDSHKDGGIFFTEPSRQERAEDYYKNKYKKL